MAVWLRPYLCGSDSKVLLDGIVSSFVTVALLCSGFETFHKVIPSNCTQCPAITHNDQQLHIHVRCVVGTILSATCRAGDTHGHLVSPQMSGIYENPLWFTLVCGILTVQQFFFICILKSLCFQSISFCQLLCFTVNFYSPPAHLYAVTYVTEISLHMR